MKALLDEFKAFIMKGNVIDLAVAVLIGVAFGDIVKAFTEGIIKPLINAVGGTPNVDLRVWVFNVGMVVNAVITFLITAGVLFFCFIKPMNKFKSLAAKREGEKPDATPEEIRLLREIRDLLRK